MVLGSVGEPRREGHLCGPFGVMALKEGTATEIVGHGKDGGGHAIEDFLHDNGWDKGWDKEMSIVYWEPA